MRERTIRDVAALVGAAPVVGDRRAGPDVVIDSRQATPGAVFVALPGERVDGHDYLDAAASRGAVAAICTRRTDAPLAHLVVPDAQQGLSDLARGVVAEAKASGLACVAVTGSSGKTSTKDLLGQLLAAAGPTVSPEGSLNNEIGVPLTALRVGDDTRYLVSELGARGGGHIAWLCGIVPPDVGLVLNVGHAHLGEFGSVAGIAAAKGELVEALPAGGWAVLNADDPLVLGMVSRTRARLATFSLVGEPDAGELRVWADDIGPDELQRHAFTLRAAGVVEAAVPVQLQGPGRHQVANALAAAAAGLVLGLPASLVGEALSGATALSRWRMQLSPRPDGVLIVNDSYNANPDSMRAALTTVAGMRRRGGRLRAVLGDMLELGPDAPAEHRALGALAAGLGFEVVAVGDFADDIAAGAREASGVVWTVADRAQAVAVAGADLQPSDVVVVKASRGLALDTVADALASGAGDTTGGPA
ncbi:MAG: UDP-N-acetylmuramoyl-tripeptide--D-alanyl-D-alanine ligase [Micropruina sp.]|uniref:UDP-N-acetylmuramoyl-tripeptide--D-alanyl-D- alanine ligase n=1 Tax=Micropruina sp. TaxID=2737536 RepID=UPI0039E3CB10